MNKRINQYINQLNLDPKREAAIRELFSLMGGGGSQSTNTMTIDINENTVFTVDDFNKIKAHADNNGLFVVNVNGAPEGRNYSGYNKFKFSAYNFYIHDTEISGLNESIITLNYVYINETTDPRDFINITFRITIFNDEVKWVID